MSRATAAVVSETFDVEKWAKALLRRCASERDGWRWLREG
jgi:hypothetical protein